MKYKPKSLKYAIILVVIAAASILIEYTKTDGSVIREYHWAYGNTWQGALVIEEFSIEE